jgi:selenocysteine lyase/cysteine desulfurase
MATPWTLRSSDWFEDARELASLFAGLIGASRECVTLVPSVSYGIAVAARNVSVARGRNIVLIDREFPSNFYSWRRLALARGAVVRSVQAEPGASLTDAVIAAIDEDTAVVAVANCRWTDGLLIDLSRVGEAARRHGAVLVVDASQSLGAYPLDVADVQPDFLTTVGYKWLLGPYGVSYLYVAERWHADGAPLEESWLHRAGSESFATLTDYTDVYNPGAERFGAGASAQFYLLPMAIAALSQVHAWTPARINGRLRAWTDELTTRAQKLSFTGPEPAQRAGHMIGLSSERALPPRLASALAERGVYVGVRGNCIRVAPHLHLSDHAIERVIGALQGVLEH